MKKILILTVAMLFVASMAFGGVIGSKHDMSSSTYNAASTMSACQFCHTPHHANSVAVGSGALPLWNRSLPGTNYTQYGVTRSSTTPGEPGLQSLTCLSCHDGNVSVGDVVIGTDDTTFVNGSVLDAAGKLKSTAAAYLGTDLTGEHPVGVEYIEAASLAGLNAGSISPYRTYNASGAPTNDPAATGTIVECSSCHNPHDNTTYPPFLLGARSDICVKCHSTK